MRVRLLPATMVVTGMVLAVKVADVLHGGEEFAQWLFVSSVQAQGAEGEKPPEPTPPVRPEEPKPQEAAKEGEKPAEAKPEEKPGAEAEKKGEGKPAAEGEAKPEAEAEKKAGDEKKAEGEGEKKEGEHAEEKSEEEKEKEKKAAEQAKLVANINTPEDTIPPEGRVSDIPPINIDGAGKGLAPGTRYFSPIELEILQTLSKRRETMDEWVKATEVKENLLSTVEKRIDEKLVQIEALKAELQGMLTQYGEQEDIKLKSLVKIYENMKPRDAARIFDEVEMPILLQVIDRMAEKKAAPILAGMDPKKAKQLTVELAEQRRQSAKVAAPPAAVGAAPAPAAAPAPPPAPKP